MNKRDRYEISVTVTVNADDVEAARTAANDMILQDGLVAGFLRILDYGPDGFGPGDPVFLGVGRSHADISALFENDEPKANLDGLFDEDTPNETQPADA